MTRSPTPRHRPRLATRGAEITLDYGVPAEVVQAARGTLGWAHSGTAGVGSDLPHLAGSGVVLTNSAAVHAEPIADGTRACSSARTWPP